MSSIEERQERYRAPESEFVYQARLAEAMIRSGWQVETTPRCWVPGVVRDGFSIGKPDLWAQLVRGAECKGSYSELIRRGIHTVVFEVKKSEDTRELNGGGFQAMGYMLGMNYKSGSKGTFKLLKRPDLAVLVFPEFLVPEVVSTRSAESINDRLHLSERLFWKRGCTVLKIEGGWVGFETNIGHDAPSFVRLFRNSWLFGEAVPRQG